MKRYTSPTITETIPCLTELDAYHAFLGVCCVKNDAINNDRPDLTLHHIGPTRNSVTTPYDLYRNPQEEP